MLDRAYTGVLTATKSVVVVLFALMIATSTGCGPRAAVQGDGISGSRLPQRGRVPGCQRALSEFVVNCWTSLTPPDPVIGEGWFGLFAPLLVSQTAKLPVPSSTRLTFYC